MNKQKESFLLKSKLLWVVITVLLILFAIITIFAAGGCSFFQNFLNGAAPAWIQAIGSVAAILAAAAIARQQSQSASHLEARKLATSEAQKFLVVKALMVRAYGLSNDICHAFTTKQHEDFDQVSPELMLDTHQALLALPIFEIPNGLLALDVLTIGRAISVIRENWLKLREEANQNPEKLALHIEQLDSLAQEVREISMAALEVCKKEITQRGFNQDGSLTETNG